MIKLVDKQDTGSLLRFCRRHPLGARIESFCTAYGTGYAFASFWLAWDGRSPYAALCLIDSALTLVAEEGPTEELSAFLQMLPFRQLTLCGSWIDRLGPEVRLAQRGSVLEWQGAPTDSLPGVLETNPPLRAVYDLLRESDPGIYCLKGFEAWYLDLSHRVRHHTARAYCLQQGRERIASLLVTAFGEASAILGGIATRPDFRGQGMATGLTRHIAGQLHAEGKRIYVMTDHPGNEYFYQKRGFSVVDTWAFLDKNER